MQKSSSSTQRTKLGQKLFVLLIRCDGIAVISLNEFWMQALWLLWRTKPMYCSKQKKNSILNCILFHFRSRFLCVRCLQKQTIFWSCLEMNFIRFGTTFMWTTQSSVKLVLICIQCQQYHFRFHSINLADLATCFKRYIYLSRRKRFEQYRY